MKRLFLTVALLLATIPSLADVSLECAQTAQWGERGIPADLQLVGTHVVAADGRGLAVWDVSNPAAIRQVSAARTLAPSRAVAISGDKALALTSQGLELFEISTSFELERVDSHDDPSISAIGANASLFAVAGLTLSIWQAVGAELVPIASTPLSGSADSVFVDEQKVFVGNQVQGVAVYELAGSTLRLVATIPVSALAIARRGDFLYIAGGGAGLQTIDISNPEQPEVLPRVLSGTSDLRDLTISGNRVFAADRLGGSRIDSFSLSDPSAPLFEGSFDQPVDTLAADSNSLFVSGRLHLPGRDLDATGSPLRIFTSGPSPEMKGEILDYAGPVSGVELSPPFAFVADPPLLRVIDFTDPADPREIAEVPMFDSADRLRLQGTILLAYGRANAHILDVSDPYHPRHLGVFRSLGTFPEGAAMAGNYLVEDNRATGFHVLDISDPANPRQISGMINDPENGQFYGLVAGDRTVYAFTPRGVKVIDLTDPFKARLDHVIPTNRIIDAAIARPTATHPELLLILEPVRLRLFDLSDPLRPAELSPIPLSSGLTLDAGSDVAYVATTEGTLVRVDLTNPGAATVTDRISGLTGPLQVSVAGDLVAVADSYSIRVLQDLQAAAVPPSARPDLRLDRSTRTVATLSWSGSDGHAWEVEVSAEPLFIAPEVSVTTGTSTTVPLGSTPIWVRVRDTRACAAGPWSDAVVIDPTQLAIEQPVCFGASGQVIVAGTAPVSIDVPITNYSSSPTSTAIVPPDGSIGVPGPAIIEPGATAIVDVSIDPTSGSAASGSAILSLENSSCTYRIVVRRAIPASVQPGTTETEILGGVAATPGARGTLWKSDLSLFCRATRCNPTIIYQAYGDLSAPAAGISVPLEEGESALIADVVRSLFGRESTLGSLMVHETQPGALLVSATTYNEGPAGRYGQRIYPARVDELSAASRRLLGVAQNQQFRTNIGLVNTSSVSHAVTLDAVDGNGTTIATSVRTLSAWEGIQISFPDFFPNVSLPFEGSVVIDNAAAVLAYASRVDSRTGDGTYSQAILRGEPVAPAGLPRYARRMSVVTSTPGAAGTDWKTAFQIVNESESDAEFVLTFVPSSDAFRATRIVRSLSGGQSLLTDDLFGDVFPDAPGSPTPYGTLAIESSVPFTGWGRIYNVGPEGTLGQYVPVSFDSPARRPLDISVANSPYGKAALTDRPWSEQILPVADTSAERTNFGLVEIAGKRASVSLKFFDSAGNLVGIADRSLEPLGSQPLFNVLGDLGLSGLPYLRVEIQHQGAGYITVYASVVQRSTGDAVYLAAQ